MDTYDTSDFQLAVTLSAIGYQLLEIDKANPRRAIFRFRLSEDISADAQAFFQDTIAINPRTVLIQSKMIKNRLYAGV